MSVFVTMWWNVTGHLRMEHSKKLSLLAERAGTKSPFLCLAFVTRRAQRGRCFEMGFANGLKDVGRMLCLVGVRVRDWDPDSRSRISKNS
jgi:hypothetical protein